MSDTKHKYYCYFIIDTVGKLVHVDVSYAKDTQAILRKHLRGEVPCTKKYFGLGEQEVIPHLHIRPAKYRTKLSSDKETAGWRCSFVEEGYQLIPADIFTDIDNLPYQARKIFMDNKNRSVFGVLLDSDSKNYYSEHRTGAASSALQKYPRETADVIISFRVTPSSATAFDEIYLESEYTTGQIFAEMINDYTGETSLFSDDLGGRLLVADAEIQRLKAENAELIRKYS